MNKLLLLVFICQLTVAQTTAERLIHGKIIVASNNVAGVTVINLVNEKTAVSDSNGEFYILAKAEDLLVFTALNLEYHRKIVEEQDLKLDLLVIKMIAKVIELKEVIINTHPQINAVSLGISPRGIKKYTPAERRLKAAEEFHWYSPLLIPLGGMSVDGLINAISGRTAMLKKELVVEKKERLLCIIKALYKDDNYFTQTLKIPTDYIKGFQYYCVEDATFAAILKTKNRTKIDLVMIPLAKKYNEIITSEN